VALKAKGWKKVRWREGTKGWLESRFVSLRVQPSNGFVDGDPPHKEIWLLVEWPEAEEEPIKYFFCDLLASYTLRRLVRITKCRWKIEQDYRQLKEELGLDHYEGRSWNGWHHHVTLVMLAYSFLTLETLRSKKNFWVDPAKDSA
jgi:SRSO17 transposase